MFIFMVTVNHIILFTWFISIKYAIIKKYLIFIFSLKYLLLILIRKIKQLINKL